MPESTITTRDALIEQVERLTHENLNTEALIEVATYFQQRDLVTAFESYLSEQAEYGYMTEDAIARRNADKVRLLDSIGLIAGERDRKVFKSLL
tara:strand:+ start:2200 stop:2481 length:282 start_codon:yes stop_codon:yes gene_type:complete